MYRIEDSSGNVRFGVAQDQHHLQPREFSVGPHGLRFHPEQFRIVQMGPGFVAYGRPPHAEQRYIVRPITLADVREIFPNSFRTFESTESLLSFLEEQRKGEYSPNYVMEKTDELFVISNPALKLLSLVKEDVEGNAHLRVGGEWAPIRKPDDCPEMFGQRIRIYPPDFYSAVMLWDHYRATGRDRNKIFNFVVPWPEGDAITLVGTGETYPER